MQRMHGEGARVIVLGHEHANEANLLQLAPNNSGKLIESLQIELIDFFPEASAGYDYYSTVINCGSWLFLFNQIRTMKRWANKKPIGIRNVFRL